MGPEPQSDPGAEEVLRVRFSELPPADPPAHEPAPPAPWVRPVLAVALLVGIPAAGQMGVRLLEGEAVLRLAPGGVRVPIDAEVPPDLRARMAELAASAPEGRSLYDPDQEAAVRAHLERSPHVARVRSLRPRPPAVLVAEVDLRVPLAVVVQGDWSGVVDREACLLGMVQAGVHDALPRIRVPGAPLSEVPHLGRRFDDSGRRPSHRAVIEAIGVVEAWRDAPAPPPAVADDWPDLHEVRVGRSDQARRPGAPDVRLITDGGLEILWGRSPRSPFAAEGLSVERKLRGLQRALRVPGGWRGDRMLDLTLDDPALAPPERRTHGGPDAPRD